MLKRVVHSLGLVDKNPRRKSKVRGTKTIPDFGLRSKDLYVKGDSSGWTTRCISGIQVDSEVSRDVCCKSMAPHHSVLRPEEHLLLGHKYVIISCKDVEKLKRKHPQQCKTKEHNGVVTLEANIIRSPSGHKPKENDKLSVPNEMINTRTTLSPSECKIHENCEVKEPNILGKEKVNEEMDVCQGGEDIEVHCSAKDFYVGNVGKTRTFPLREVKIGT
ncbi:hypothetical protein GYH30_002943 [Glycine max]|uniref:Uncharacterized protein n=1 Tax=Glycine soja TaxID=3848 RepID=A0A445LJI6_GLYSO|nr:hypothetical protein GYH30_002943 [Glycine max]RZC23312.1 hypothetical protein D0Y65_002903 [Glycine soja]